MAGPGNLPVGARSDGGDTNGPIPKPSPPLIEELIVPDLPPLPVKKPMAGPATSRARISLADSEALQAQLRKVHSFRTRGNLAAAESEAQAAVQQSNGDPAAYSMLGDIQKQAGKTKIALATYESAKALMPPGAERAVLEAKIARAVLELNAVQRIPDSAPVDRASAGIIISASALAPGLGQILAGQIVKGAILFGIWLVSAIALARCPASSALIGGVLRIPLKTAPASTAGDFAACLLAFINTATWVYAVLDAVAAARQK